MKWLTHVATAAQRVAADEGRMLAASTSRIVSPLSGWPTDWRAARPRHRSGCAASTSALTCPSPLKVCALTGVHVAGLTTSHSETPYQARETHKPFRRAQLPSPSAVIAVGRDGRAERARRPREARGTPPTTGIERGGEKHEQESSRCWRHRIPRCPPRRATCAGWLLPGRRSQASAPYPRNACEPGRRGPVRRADGSEQLAPGPPATARTYSRWRG